MSWPRAIAATVIAAVVLSPPAGAKRIGTYSAKHVRYGFAAVGDPVFDAGYSSFASPVTILSTISPRDGWTATIYVYPSVSKAVSSFEANRRLWLRGGIASEQLGNLVVTVSHVGKQDPAQAKPAVPALVVKALAIAAKR
jgi:hypothetical protein